jgi:REP element-mobilizing transposase RayT
VERKYEYRRCLPHYQKDNRLLFITYATCHRWKLPDIAKDLALESCLRASGRKYSLYATVVMPDHVHLICMPLIDDNGSISIPEITRTVKSESAHRINKALGRLAGFGKMNLSITSCAAKRASRMKMTYILENPIRAGLVTRSQDYRWLWRDRTVAGISA